MIVAAGLVALVLAGALTLMLAIAVGLIPHD
jgi:hypothetical protein